MDLDPELARGRTHLFADLENCTVANDTNITGSRAARPSPKITVKIVRAHGGCLGTKSR